MVEQLGLFPEARPAAVQAPSPEKQELQRQARVVNDTFYSSVSAGERLQVVRRLPADRLAALLALPLDCPFLQPTVRKAIASRYVRLTREPKEARRG